MKKVIMGIALALSLTGLGYSGFSIGKKVIEQAN